MSVKSAHAAVAANVLAATSTAVPGTEPKTITTPVTPTGPPKGGTPNEPKPLLDGKGELTLAGKAFVEKNLTEAATTLHNGLATIHASKIQPGQSAIGALENGFEAARLAKANGTVAALKAAGEALELLAGILANHSVNDPNVLTNARQAWQGNQKAITAVTPA